MSWNNLNTIASRQYRGGHSSNIVVIGIGYFSNKAGRLIYICPHCDKPTDFDGTVPLPGVPFGNSVAYVPQDIDALYLEARKCAYASAYTTGL